MYSTFCLKVFLDLKGNSLHKRKCSIWRGTNLRVSERKVDSEIYQPYVLSMDKTLLSIYQLGRRRAGGDLGPVIGI